MASPRPVRSPGGHRHYALAEIEALRMTLAETHNVSSAMALARERGDGPSSPARLAPRYASLRRGQGQPHAGGEPDAALDRADDRGGPARRVAS